MGDIRTEIQTANTIDDVSPHVFNIERLSGERTTYLERDNRHRDGGERRWTGTKSPGSYTTELHPCWQARLIENHKCGRKVEKGFFTASVASNFLSHPSRPRQLPPKQ